MIRNFLVGGGGCYLESVVRKDFFSKEYLSRVVKKMRKQFLWFFGEELENGLCKGCFVEKGLRSGVRIRGQCGEVSEREQQSG